MFVKGTWTHPCHSFAVGKPAMVVVRVQGASPIGPLAGRLFNQIDVLNLCILLCGEKKHRERSSLDCRLSLRSKGPLAVRMFYLSGSILYEHWQAGE